MSDTNKKYCFIIGPMLEIPDRDANDSQMVYRLEKLKNEIILPLLNENNPDGWEVDTPHDLPDGNIMDNVVSAIDRADLAIVDITPLHGSYNPNVFYEMSLAHAVGTPTFQVREKPDSKMNIPFDMAAYRYYDIEIYKPLEAKEILRPRLKGVLSQLENNEVHPNPITDYYREPVTNISPAAGVAQGYFQNFVKPAVEKLNDIDDLNVRNHRYPIPFVDEQRELPIEVRSRAPVKLTIIIPGQIEFAKERKMKIFKAACPHEVSIPAGRRGLTVSCREDSNTIPQLYDVPTALNVLQSAIEKRMNSIRINPESLSYARMEQREIERFVLELKEWIKYDDHRNDTGIQERVSIYRFNPEKFDRDWLWLYDAWA